MFIPALRPVSSNLLSLVKCTAPVGLRYCSSKPSNGQHSSSPVSTNPLEQSLYSKLTVSDALAFPLNEKVAVQGWVRSLRRLKENTFLSVHDGLSAKKIQIVVPNSILEEKDLKAQFGQSVYCEGILTQSKGPEQPVEINCDNIKLLSPCDPLKFPFNSATGKNNNWKGMRQHLHLRSRVPTYGSLMRLRSDLNHYINQLMKEHNYINVTTPILTKNDCEGGCKPFIVKPIDYPDDVSFFKGQAKLTVSAQLHLETAACALSRVYTCGPTFRAEHTRSRRHLSEFTMFEVEEAFIDDLDTLMNRAEFIMKSLCEALLSENNDDLTEILKSTKYNLGYRLTGKYLRLTYEEAIDLVNKRQNIQPIKYGQDLAAYHETVLLDYFENQPLFITHFPQETRPFYMKSDGDKALCFDLLAPIGGEVCGGSLREDDLEKIEAKMEGMEGGEELDWYLDLRRFGSVPHGGFGFGFDRLIQSLTGLNNIKDVVPFPRYLYHCDL